MEVLKAISEDTRMKMITMLLDGSMCVGCMAKRKGYFIHYSLDKGRLLMLAKELEKLAEGIMADGNSLCGYGRCGKGECRCRKM